MQVSRWQRFMIWLGIRYVCPTHGYVRDQGMFSKDPCPTCDAKAWSEWWKEQEQIERDREASQMAYSIRKALQDPVTRLLLLEIIRKTVNEEVSKCK